MSLTSPCPCPVHDLSLHALPSGAEGEGEDGGEGSHETCEPLLDGLTGDGVENDGLEGSAEDDDRSPK